MDCIKKAEMEEIERMKERLLNVRDNLVNKGSNQIVVGEYINTLPKPRPNNKNETRVIRDRKFYREYNEKIVKESMERIKENTRKVLENG